MRLCRAYGNWRKDHLQGWGAILQKYAITPIQQFDDVSGKNATDIALTMDAMDLLQTIQPQIFGIFAGDSDYTPLVVRLISSGAQVFDFGCRQASSISFRAACTEFIALNSEIKSTSQTAVPSQSNVVANKYATPLPANGNLLD
ncbi:MAG: NYN domain-containing protein [Leptolyngbya sp. SIO1D8]|nr:NYN domain-containing protein [Leptolyngbya sp. SIO1D8]